MESGGGKATWPAIAMIIIIMISHRSGRFGLLTARRKYLKLEICCVFGSYSSQRLLISEWSKTTKRSTTMNSFHFPFSLQGRKVLPRPLKDGLRALLPFLLGSASLSPPSASSCRSTSPSSSSPCSSLLLQLL